MNNQPARRILVVDDNAEAAALLAVLLQLEGHEVQTAANCDEAMDTAERFRPEVVLMDEPCSALDPTATAKIEELIQDLEWYYTIIIVTHNMQQAARCSDFTAFFYLGRLNEFDATEKIFTNPSNKQTEDYITGRFG